MVDDEWVYCSYPECDARIKNHAWGRVRSAWFESKSGESWCPKHIPDWVAEWRSQDKIRKTNLDG